MLVQSGKPVGVFRTHEWAPRVLIAELQPRRRLGDLAGVPPPRAARPDDVRPDDRRLVDLHRHAGHPAGHLRDVRRRRREAVRRHARRHPHPHRRLRRHGRRAAAGRHDERGRRAHASTSIPRASARRVEHRYLDESPTTSTTRSTRVARRRSARRARPLSVGLRRQRRRRVVPRAARGATRRSTSSPTRPRRTTRSSYLPDRHRLRRLATYADRKTRGVHRARARRRWPSTSRRWSASWTPAPRSSTTATRSAARRSSGGYDRAFDFPGFVPAYIRPLFCEGKGPFRWVALSGDPEDIAATDRAVLELFPDNDAPAPLDHHGAGARRLPGPARPHLLARLRRARQGRAARSTSWSPSGEVERARS